MNRKISWAGKVSVLLLAGCVGGVVGRLIPLRTSDVVHAQATSSENSNCIVAVPKSWGEFRGASAFGLAFEDQDGAVRFLEHPSCANMNAPTDAYMVDLKVIRK